MFKLKKIITKQSDQSWQLYIDSSTTLNKDTDPRDSSGGTISEEDHSTFTKVVWRPNKQDTPGYIAWDREYIGENSVAFIYYFDTAENAKLYYQNLQKQVRTDPIPDNVKINKSYSNVWYITDEQNNIVPWSKV